MTTRSIHQYVLGILEKVGVDERDITKIQTGGPDGDLGSNEIKISLDKTVAVVDGGGVLYDPDGLDRDELRRLAQHRALSKNFDMSKLGERGQYIDIEHNDVTIKSSGDVIDSGLSFRNYFHLSSLATADLFVPCGGRPKAVNISNVAQLFDKDGKVKFRWIVEGANLFFTQDARLELEKHGVIIYKDASANKGGVTSSSLEVFAALSLTDEEFAEHMCGTDGSASVPAFYKKYIVDVHRIIEKNARAEFEAIWREHERSGRPRCVITDLLSEKINKLVDDINSSGALWHDTVVRDAVLIQSCPPSLLELVGLDAIIERVPQSYLKAKFSAQIASTYVYECGLDATEFDFYNLLQRIRADAAAAAAVRRNSAGATPTKAATTPSKSLKRKKSKRKL
mmetsp:Transcript_56450/g.138702  ORF Transcript_56450/g.138702 Transcript_56450/m.138702 type:complete len:396 (-) Transcript_56450:114-1301(-)